MIFNVALEGSDLEVVGQGLDELKFKVAAPVARKIQEQINAQLAAEAAGGGLERPVEPERRPRAKKR